MALYRDTGDLEAMMDAVARCSYCWEVLGLNKGRGGHLELVGMLERVGMTEVMGDAVGHRSCCWEGLGLHKGRSGH